MSLDVHSICPICPPFPLSPSPPLMMMMVPVARRQRTNTLFCLQRRHAHIRMVSLTVKRRTFFTRSAWRIRPKRRGPSGAWQLCDRRHDSEDRSHNVFPVEITTRGKIDSSPRRPEFSQMISALRVQAIPGEEGRNIEPTTWTQDTEPSSVLPNAPRSRRSLGDSPQVQEDHPVRASHHPPGGE